MASDEPLDPFRAPDAALPVSPAAPLGLFAAFGGIVLCLYALVLGATVAWLLAVDVPDSPGELLAELALLALALLSFVVGWRLADRRRPGPTGWLALVGHLVLLGLALIGLDVLQVSVS